MKKLLTYTLITTMISCFSYVNPSFADTQIKNQNIIKLDLKETNNFKLAYNNDQLFLANNISSPTGEIDCAGKQTTYSVVGGLLGGLGGALLVGLLGMGLASRDTGYQPGLGTLYITIFLGLPVGALVGGLFGALKGNEIAINECIANKNKVSLNKNNDFEIALFTKDF